MRIFASSIALALSASLVACSGPQETGAQAAPAGAAGLERPSFTPKQANDSYFISAAQSVARREGEAFQPHAKNVILFVGDGMGISTITAARIYAGQSRGVDGESYHLTMETLPNVALSKTYSHDSQVSDSASTATAMVTGVKARSRTLGLTQDAAFGECASAAGHGTDSIFEIPIPSAQSVARRKGEAFQPHAKNVILFVGDGMGISTITAARIYAGQSRGVDGESYHLTMETLPNVALSKTYSHDSQVSDSASTATAMVTGVKARSRTLGLTQDAAFGECASAAGHGTDSIFELAERAGLATGIVSTARLTHATPAATYSESASRNWEIDGAMIGAAEGCKDIAAQFIDWQAGDGFEIALAGGRRMFLPNETPDPEYEGMTGQRTDGRDLSAEWTHKSNQHYVVYDRAGFDGIDFASDARVLGLFERSHMQYELDRAEDTGGEPSLAEMTTAAITRLSQNESGYVLMVEGGRIDHAHHGVNAARALSDTVAFDNAVAAALEMTSAQDTLIIVTADHSHTLTIAGYPERGNPILGLVKYVTGDTAMGEDGMPYTTLGYMNGKSACRRKEGKWDCARQDLSEVDILDKDFLQQSLVFLSSETHGGEDVAIFASGPGSELVEGVMEQNEIFHVMGAASGLVAQ